VEKIDTKEIVAVARWSKWHAVKGFIKNIIRHTLNSDVAL